MHFKLFVSESKHMSKLKRHASITEVRREAAESRIGMLYWTSVVIHP